MVATYEPVVATYEPALSSTAPGTCRLSALSYPLRVSTSTRRVAAARKYTLPDPSHRRRVEQALRALEGWSERPEQACAYRLDFAGEGERVVAKQYTNGTLFLQAAGPAGPLFERLVATVEAAGAVAAAPVARAASRGPRGTSVVANVARPFDLPWIGSDESGKGDYFGPLVICAVYVDERSLALFEALGVRDSKQLTDSQIHRLAQQVRAVAGGAARLADRTRAGRWGAQEVRAAAGGASAARPPPSAPRPTTPATDGEHAATEQEATEQEATERTAAEQEAMERYVEVVIAPERYNALYEQLRAEGKRLNALLAWAHARAIGTLLERVPCEHVIVDQFADAHYLQTRLAARARVQRLEIVQVPGAEANLAVAAASVLARDCFVRWLERQSRELGLPLPKGASAQVEAAARRIVATHGPEVLRRVAKLHFKTTERVLAPATSSESASGR